MRKCYNTYSYRFFIECFTFNLQLWLFKITIFKITTPSLVQNSVIAATVPSLHAEAEVLKECETFGIALI
jgi:hypothetical protein